MSETWISLLAALVGAIVGGAASLAATMVVNKQQMATNAQMRLYDELLPKLETAVDTIINPQLPGDELAEEQVPELLEKVRRASAIAGPFERKAAHNLWSLWVEQASQKKTPTPYTSPPVYRLRDELRALSNHLAAKLG